ncbi:hypothetical protein EVG20_g10095 [Dentipellis fragilis]|uniref:Uncharacterized protein n=1 Tax=Dentipellis fragilis TaxID=205917 RepID=A0A4Y9XTP1_9AGAM|nr:hypothetical protein EVG20_g10095 [Dentipellis fragilis]
MKVPGARQGPLRHTMCNAPTTGTEEKIQGKISDIASSWSMHVAHEGAKHKAAIKRKAPDITALATNRRPTRDRSTHTGAYQASDRLCDQQTRAVVLRRDLQLSLLVLLAPGRR